MNSSFSIEVERFRHDYARHRASEGRGYSGEQLRRLPYLKTGPFARQWQVRARTFDAFRRFAARERQGLLGRPFVMLDLGCGNGWLSYRFSREGNDCVAIDIRDDDVDGLGAARALQADTPFERLVASFDAVPLPDGFADVAVFNASLHYATDLAAALAEAARLVRPGGTVAILDSPFYADAAAGEAMVAEKHASASERFGDHAASLLSIPFIEYLTADRLAAASHALGLRWRRHRVRYPLWYELRPLVARLRGDRAPSRFDFWTARR